MDRNLKVAFGSGRQAIKWTNKTITFDELCDRLKTPVRTSETAEEYQQLPKDERDSIKDKGGMVGGHFIDGRRKTGNLICRSIGTADVDSPDTGFLDRYRKEHRFTSVLYTTHSHTPADPRYRIFIPFTRDVTAEEYVAIMRWFADEIGIECVDPCSYRVHQLMYWPTASADGEYIFERFEGDWLDPDAFLAEHPNWKDIASLPVSSKEKKMEKHAAKHQEDPLTKAGVIGAFNNVFFPISRLIEEQLSDVYEATEIENRYTHVGSSGTAGAIVYEDRFLYSHHATDPACGKLLNAFDLMRIHKFGDEESSIIKALKYAASIPEVQEWLNTCPVSDFDENLRPAYKTDVDEARVFAEQYCDYIRHSTATDFLVYDGTMWVESEARAHRKLHELTDRQLAEHAEDYTAAKLAFETAGKALGRAKVALVGSTDETSKVSKLQADADLKEVERKYKAEEAYHQFLLKCRNSGKIAGILEESKALLEIDVEDLDSDPFLLNTPGGEVDLRTGELLSHDPNHFHTRITKATPSDEGMDIWLDFLKVITCKDKELEEYLQITSGEELIGRIYNESLRIQIGQGSNGKSTYTNTKLRVLGSYGGQITAESLTISNKNNKNWEIAELRGRRLIVAGELQEGAHLSDAMVKKLCSTDPILGEKKHKAPFTFLPSHTVVLYTNHLPKVHSRDNGIWKRLTVIPFNANIMGKSEIKNYSDYLFENAGGAILKWMIEGAKRYVAANFKIHTPKCVEAASRQYRDDSDWVSAFLDECCKLGVNEKVQSSVLYQTYRSYCDTIGEYKRTPQDFKAAMTGLGYELKKTKGSNVYVGLDIRKDSIPAADDDDDFLR